MTTFLPESIKLDVGRRYDWRLFLIVLAGCLVGLFGVVPYQLTQIGISLNDVMASEQLRSVIPIQLAVGAIQMVIVAALGVLLATRIGLGLPFIEGALNKQPIWGILGRIALIAAVLGVVGALIIIGLDIVVFSASMKAAIESSSAVIPENINPPAWQGFLASFYGGIAEEVMLRLFVLSLLAWLGRFISNTAENRPTVAVLWIANILAAVLFGLGHLPAMAQMGIPITEMIVVRAVVLNGLLGVVAGWLYARWGLESAIVCHFSGDIILHVMLPLLT